MSPTPTVAEDLQFLVEDLQTLREAASSAASRISVCLRDGVGLDEADVEQLKAWSTALITAARDISAAVGKQVNPELPHMRDALDEWSRQQEAAAAEKHRRLRDLERQIAQLRPVLENALGSVRPGLQEMVDGLVAEKVDLEAQLRPSIRGGTADRSYRGSAGRVRASG